MSEFSASIQSLKYKAESREELKSIISELEESYRNKYSMYETMLQAQRILATVSDQNTKRVLGYIQGVVNKSLRTMYPNGSYNIRIEKKLYNNQIPHINVTLTEVKDNGDTQQLDFNLQSGDGMAQIVSFLFSLCLMKIREVRPLVGLDEVLKGFHKDALPYIRTIIEIFARGGFQFIMVEYDFNDFGKEYEVKKERGVSYLQLVDRETDLEFEEAAITEEQ